MITLGILGSGSGSNMQAILDAIQSQSLDAKIGIVLSDRPDAYILKRAQNYGIPTDIIDCSPYKMKFPEERQEWTANRLKEAGVDLVCLAGFMRLVKKPLLKAFPNRILNIHPSLLPSFPGLEAWKQAIEAGVSESGVTVHLVDEGMDTGPILGSEIVPIFPNDTAETLHARIQVSEHSLYTEVIRNYIKSLSL